MSLLDDILKGLPVNPLLREKVTELEAKYAATETENAILKDDIREAKAENQKLKQQIEELTHTDDLDETAQKLLILIAEPGVTYVHNLVTATNLPEATVKCYIGHLKTLRYVEGKGTRIGQMAYYKATQKGLEFLHKNKLIQ